MTTATKETYANLDAAYLYFNKHLFEGKLPKVAVTLTRKHNALGYYSPERFSNADGEKVPEIALNPEYMRRGNLEVLSTLVHEMCHVWQHCFGKPSRTGYHNREFAEKMAMCGLICSTTGAPGGKITGQKMSHYIDYGGKFCDLANTFKKSITDWSALPYPAKESKPASKVKYTCPGCQQNAWAKPNAKLMCGACYAQGSDLQMLPEGRESEAGDDDTEG